MLPENMRVPATHMHGLGVRCTEGVPVGGPLAEWLSMLLLLWLGAAGPNYSGSCGMSHCALPVYFRPGSLCTNTQARREGREQRRQSDGSIAPK